jgi:hypothetical protein
MNPTLKDDWAARLVQRSDDRRIPRERWVDTRSAMPASIAWARASEGRLSRMRPGQNRRMRGRTRSKGPNPLTRSFESNGPDVKIRGTAQHIADKYVQLGARCAGERRPRGGRELPPARRALLPHHRGGSGAVRQQYGVVQRPFDDEGDEEDDGPGFGDRPQPDPTAWTTIRPCSPSPTRSGSRRPTGPSGPSASTGAATGRIVVRTEARIEARTAAASARTGGRTVASASSAATGSPGLSSTASASPARTSAPTVRTAAGASAASSAATARIVVRTARPGSRVRSALRVPRARSAPPGRRARSRRAIGPSVRSAPPGRAPPAARGAGRAAP